MNHFKHIINKFGNLGICLSSNPGVLQMTLLLCSTIFLVLVGISMILDVYLKFLEVTEDSEVIILGLMKTSSIRFKDKGLNRISFSKVPVGSNFQEHIPQKRAA